MPINNDQKLTLLKGDFTEAGDGDVVEGFMGKSGSGLKFYTPGVQRISNGHVWKYMKSKKWQRRRNRAFIGTRFMNFKANKAIMANSPHKFEIKD